MCIHAENIGLKIETCVSFQVLFDIANYLGVKGESFENFKTSLDACFPHCKVRICSSLLEISFKNYFFSNTSPVVRKRKFIQTPRMFLKCGQSSYLEDNFVTKLLHILRISQM